MAGFYPDVPAPRMAYDRDGTRLVYTHLGSSLIRAEYEPNNPHIISMNDELASNFRVGAWGVETVGITAIFPQIRTVMGYTFIQAYTYRGTWGNFQYSPDTTSGIDGTWITVEANRPINYNLESLRNSIRVITPVQAKAVRWTPYTGSNTEMWYHGFHLYGQIDDSGTPDRLRIWHPTLDEPLDENNPADGAYLDWGDVTRGTTADRTFRVKNNSQTLTANSIVVGTQAITNASVSLPPQFTYSDGGSFSTTLNITSLAPGIMSQVITVRRTTPSNANLSLWWCRTNVEAGSWS